MLIMYNRCLFLQSRRPGHLRLCVSLHWVYQSRRLWGLQCFFLGSKKGFKKKEIQMVERIFEREMKRF